MTKYFSVDISNDIHIINLCETLEQARETCLAGATDAHEFADDMDEYENYESNDLPYAVYGVVLGKAECKKKTLTEEEKDERCSDFDYVLEKPEIVDYPKDDNWIKCSERLPEIFDHNGLERSDVVMCFGLEEQDDPKTYFLAYRVHGNRFYSFNGECAKITHWQPLPLPPPE